MSHGRSNAKWAVTPTTAAVSTTPGTASIAKLTHTFRSTGTERLSPP